MGTVLMIDTPRGPARAHLDEPDRPTLLLVLHHGAGGGVQAPDLVAVTRAAVAAGYAVARVEQPYRVAGRRVPAPAPQLDEAWLAVIAALRERHPDLPLVFGGRSMGARVACRTAVAAGARGVLALAFPLHPPGRPEKSRLAELDGAGVPVLVLQGDRDPFGMPPPGPAREILVFPGARHDLRTDLPGVAQAAVDWLAARTESIIEK